MITTGEARCAVLSNGTRLFYQFLDVCAIHGPLQSQSEHSSDKKESKTWRGCMRVPQLFLGCIRFFLLSSTVASSVARPHFENVYPVDVKEGIDGKRAQRGHGKAERASVNECLARRRVILAFLFVVRPPRGGLLTSFLPSFFPSSHTDQLHKDERKKT